MPILTKDETYEIERPVVMLSPRRGMNADGAEREMYPSAFQPLFEQHGISAVQCVLHLSGGRLRHGTGLKIWCGNRVDDLSEMRLIDLHPDAQLAVARYAFSRQTLDPIELVERHIDPEDIHEFEVFYMPHATVITRATYNVQHHLDELTGRDVEDSFYYGPSLDRLLGFAYALKPQSNHERLESDMLIQRDIDRQTAIMNLETGFRFKSLIKEGRHE